MQINDGSEILVCEIDVDFAEPSAARNSGAPPRGMVVTLPLCGSILGWTWPVHREGNYRKPRRNNSLFQSSGCGIDG